MAIADQGDQCVDGALGRCIQLRGADVQRRYTHPFLVEITHPAACSIAKRNTGHPTVHLRALAFPGRGLRLHDLASNRTPPRDGVGHRLMLVVDHKKTAPGP